MSTVEVIKLVSAGTSLVMEVESAEQVPVGKYPEYAFVGVEVVGDNQIRPVEIRVPKQSADRQLGRLELTLADTIGKTLRFSRDENKQDASKPYWGITVTGGASNDARPSVPIAGTSKNSVETAQPKATPQAATGHALYEKITDYVLGTIKPKYDKAGIGLSPEASAAIVATLYIQANK